VNAASDNIHSADSADSSSRDGGQVGVQEGARWEVRYSDEAGEKEVVKLEGTDDIEEKQLMEDTQSRIVALLQAEAALWDAPAGIAVPLACEVPGVVHRGCLLRDVEVPQAGLAAHWVRKGNH